MSTVISCHAFDWSTRVPPLSIRYTLPPPGNSPPPSLIRLLIASYSVVSSCNITLHDLWVLHFRLADEKPLFSDPLFPRPFLAVLLLPSYLIASPGEHHRASPSRTTHSFIASHKNHSPHLLTHSARRRRPANRFRFVPNTRCPVSRSLLFPRSYQFLRGEPVLLTLHTSLGIALSLPFTTLPFS